MVPFFLLLIFTHFGFGCHFRFQEFIIAFKYLPVPHFFQSIKCHGIIQIVMFPFHTIMIHTPKNDFSTVAMTTKKMQLPNHAAATRLVSGSPPFHF